jgi:hypothetical protein
MMGNAKVEIELSNGGRRSFAFNVKGRGSDDIEQKVERFARMKADQHDCSRILTWEVRFGKRLAHLGFVTYSKRKGVTGDYRTEESR